MNMKWQYRTILFEFKKDGILGDRYIDDDEMEQVLNEYGSKGWELVSVSPVQEGLLSFFKRALPHSQRPPAAKPPGSANISAKNIESAGESVQKQQSPVERKSFGPSGGKGDKPIQQPGGIGEIKIS